MPKGTQKKTRAKSAKIIKSREVEQKNSIKDIFKFGESYTSLILGIIFVVILTVILLTFVKGKNATINTQNIQVTKDAEQKVTSQQQVVITPEVTKKVLEHKNVTIIPTKPQQKEVIVDAKAVSTYIVKEGDTLWKIAENKYKSGYNWVDIQKANNLTNPGMLYAGTKLILPNVQAKTVTVVTMAVEKQDAATSSIQTKKISGTSYTIEKSDTLWDIAVRAYGDGYAWTKIAKANNLLNNPSTIHSGNKLTIPRE